LSIAEPKRNNEAKEKQTASRHIKRKLKEVSNSLWHWNIQLSEDKIESMFEFMK
jgi:hypothetical protein